ncbi:Hypothetical_protein [Hexamita inflata]|uniref:Hypothetical_protein n=1 Tax=Hexamita inflata TaxID=28002 RepID=A0AA86QE55_9EUKA|nr:Hypothetical protein HINF_LOCUS42791 [Hexamita inflata]
MPGAVISQKLPQGLVFSDLECVFGGEIEKQTPEVFQCLQHFQNSFLKPIGLPRMQTNPSSKLKSELKLIIFTEIEAKVTSNSFCRKQNIFQFQFHSELEKLEAITRCLNYNYTQAHLCFFTQHLNQSSCFLVTLIQKNMMRRTTVSKGIKKLLLFGRVNRDYVRIRVYELLIFQVRKKKRKDLKDRMISIYKRNLRFDLIFNNSFIQNSNCFGIQTERTAEIIGKIYLSLFSLGREYFSKIIFN